MRIAFISLMDAFSWGGSEEMWYRCAKLAQKENNQLFISVLDWGEITSEKLSYFSLPGNILHLRPRSQKPSIFQRIKNKLKTSNTDLFYQLSRFKPDIVIISQGDAFSVVRKSYLIQKLIDRQIQYILIAQFNVEHGVLPHIILNRIRSIFLSAKNIIFVSQRNLDVAIRQLAVNLPHAKVLHNPIKFDKKEIVPFPKTPHLIFSNVARLDCNYKGQDLLLQVLSEDQWKSRNWILQLFGTGPDEQYLRDLVGFYKLKDKVKFCGYVDNVEFIWRNSHILLLPSINEGTPLTLLEAMSCGRTALVTDVGGNQSFIKNGVNGFIVDAPTVRLLAKGMEEVWNYRNNLRDLGEAAFHTVSEAFSEPPEQTLLKLAETKSRG